MTGDANALQTNKQTFYSRKITETMLTLQNAIVAGGDEVAIGSGENSFCSTRDGMY